MKKTLILKDCAPHCSEHHKREDAAGGSLLPQVSRGQNRGSKRRSARAVNCTTGPERAGTTTFRVNIKQACALSPREMWPRSSRLLTANTTLGKGTDRKWSRPSVLGDPRRGIPQPQLLLRLHSTREETRIRGEGALLKDTISRGVWIQTQAVWLQNLNEKSLLHGMWVEVKKLKKSK